MAEVQIVLLGIRNVFYQLPLLCSFVGPLLVKTDGDASNGPEQPLQQRGAT